MARRKITQGTIYFYLKPESNKSEYGTLMFRYSYQGKPKAMSTGIKMLPFNWDGEDKEPIYIPKPLAKTLAPDIKFSNFLTKGQVMDIVAELNQIELRVKDIEFGLRTISSQNVIDKLKNPDEKPVYFTDFIEEVVEGNRSTLKDATFVVYNTMLNMARDYESIQGRKYEVSEIGHNYLKGLCEFMVAKDLKNSTINRRLKHFKGFVSKARKRGYDIDATYLDYKWKEDDRDLPLTGWLSMSSF